MDKRVGDRSQRGETRETARAEQRETRGRTHASAFHSPTRKNGFQKGCGLNHEKRKYFLSVWELGVNFVEREEPRPD